MKGWRSEDGATRHYPSPPPDVHPKQISMWTDLAIIASSVTAWSALFKVFYCGGRYHFISWAGIHKSAFPLQVKIKMSTQKTINWKNPNLQVTNKHSFPLSKKPCFLLTTICPYYLKNGVKEPLASWLSEKIALGEQSKFMLSVFKYTFDQCMT